MTAPARSRTPAGSPLRRRDFRLLWIGQTTSTLGSMISVVALPLVAVSSLHASTLQVSALPAASWLPWLLVGLPAGAWVDRLPRRPVMITCDVISLLLFLSVPVAAWYGALTMAHLLAVAFLGGVSTVFFQTAYNAYLPVILPPEELTAGNAMLMGSESAAYVGGPGLAGLIAQAFTAVAGLLADAASFLVSAICLLRIGARETREPRARPRDGLRREIAEGLRFVARDPYLRVLTVSGAAANLALNGYQALLVVFLLRVVEIGPGAAGLVVAGMSLGGLAGAAVAARFARRVGTARAMVLCQLGGMPFGLLIPLTGPGWGLAFAVAGGVVLSAAITVGNVVKGAFRQAYVPGHLLGRVLVSMQFLNYGAIPVGALLGGALGGAIGVRTTLWVMMAALVPSTLILLIGPMARRRDLPERAPEPEIFEDSPEDRAGKAP
ncbi:MFS transporter [Microbispora sp. NPDC049125]|uniref:MFS transporter n=1 Tax=Microbispora sp. NPDC049125 TaxID=3154929 RepID=UPI003466224E